jgi:hypothetical protein
MFNRQAELQVTHFGLTPPWKMEGEERRQYVTAMTLALIDELSEMLREVAWKPWAKDDYIHEDAYLGELIDAWHFMMNLALVVDPSGQRFVDAYFAKAKVNEERQARGYSVLEMKCPMCGRAMDEPYDNGSNVCRHCNWTEDDVHV